MYYLHTSLHYRTHTLLSSVLLASAARAFYSDRFASAWLGSDLLTESKSLSFRLRNGVCLLNIGTNGWWWSRGRGEVVKRVGRMRSLLMAGSLVGRGGGRLDGICSSACFLRACFNRSGGGERRDDLDLVNALIERLCVCGVRKVEWLCLPAATSRANACQLLAIKHNRKSWAVLNV